MATCDLCEHPESQHWTININTGRTMNGPCKDTDYEDAESYPCMCDFFEPRCIEVYFKKLFFKNGTRFIRFFVDYTN